MQEKDYEWFLSNYESLFQKYGCAYLAIKNTTVLGAYKTYAEGVRKTEETEPIGSFIVQLCNGRKDAYTNYISSLDISFVKG